MNWETFFLNTLDTPFVTRALSTVVLIALTIGIRSIIFRELSARKEWDATTRRQWIVTTRNAVLLIILAIIVVIWLEQLRAVAATVVVIAAAVVVATKEFLLNILGFFYQSSAKFISVGDRIEIDQIRGDVIDQNLLGITLLEIGSGEKTNQYTGLTVYVPNSKLLASPIKNETHLWEDYVFHLITIPIGKEHSWEASENALLRAANEVCAPYLDTATRSMKSLSQRHSLEEPSVNPRINVQVAAPDKINLILRMPVPTRQRGRLEQEVTRRYLRFMKEKVIEKASNHLDEEQHAPPY